VLATVDIARIPFPAGAARPPAHRPYTQAVPEVGGGLTMADGLRVDVFPVPVGLQKADPENAAERAVTGLLSVLRWKTGQWWVGHAHREFEGLLRQWYPAHRHGQLDEGTVSLPVRIEPRMGFETPITPDLFASAAEMAVSNQRGPVHWDAFLDSVFYFIASDSLPRAVVEAAVSCELAVENAVATLAAKRERPFETMSRVLNRGDLVGNLQTAVPKLLERSYPSEHPRQFAQIVTLWRVRGSIVHGRLAGVDRRADVPDREAVAELLTASHQLLSWLDAVVAVV
jgi:hypothetical protein